MARSFPSCLLSFTYCFSRFILDFFFANILHLSFLVCSSPLWFFLHCCMSGICVCLCMKGRTKKKTKKLPFMGSRKILCVALEAGFYVSSNFLLLLHHRIFSFSVLFTKDHCLYVYAHHQKKKDCSFVLTRHICV